MIQFFLFLTIEIEIFIDSQIASPKRGQALWKWRRRAKEWASTSQHDFTRDSSKTKKKTKYQQYDYNNIVIKGYHRQPPQPKNDNYN